MPHRMVAIFFNSGNSTKYLAQKESDQKTSISSHLIMTEYICSQEQSPLIYRKKRRMMIKHLYFCMCLNALDQLQKCFFKLNFLTTCLFFPPSLYYSKLCVLNFELFIQIHLNPASFMKIF